MMEDWTEYKMGDLVDLKQGFALNKKSNHHISEVETEYPLLKISDLLNNTETLFVKDTIPSQFLVEPNEIIYSRTGQVGHAFTGRRGVVYNNCFKVIPNDLIDRNFLFHLLNSQPVRELAKVLATGAAQPDLNHGAFKSIKVTVPKLPNQRKIASILSAYDDLIENNLKRIKLLEEKAQLTYEEWFVRMKFPGHETTPINKETGLPEEWEKKKINEIADFQNGYAFYTKGYSDSGYAVIDLANVSEWGDLNITGKEKFISEELYESLPKFHLQKYDIIIAMTDVTSALRILAKSAIIDKDNTYALNQRVGMLRPNTDLFDYSFLYALLGDIRFIERMKAMSKGAFQFYFNTKDIVNYETFVPSKEIIDEFVKQYKPILELRMKLKDQNKSLKEARDILLPRLMTGMIDVEKMDLENLQPTTA